jgi:hypothetical protein
MFASAPWDPSATAAESLGTALDIGGSHVMIITNTGTQDDTLFVYGMALNSADSVGVAGADPDTAWFYLDAADTAGTCRMSTQKFSGIVQLKRFSTGTMFRAVNYALVSYWNNNGADFTLTDFEFDGWGGAADSVKVWIRPHKLIGWSYDGAGVFGTGNYPTPITKLSDIVAANILVGAGTHFNWRQALINTAFDVSESQGLVVDIQTFANGSIVSSNTTIGWTE